MGIRERWAMVCQKIELPPPITFQIFYICFDIAPLTVPNRLSVLVPFDVLQ